MLIRKIAQGYMAGKVMIVPRDRLCIRARSARPLSMQRSPATAVEFQTLLGMVDETVHYGQVLGGGASGS
ncbi:hypothetical protein NCU17185 [Neurospora crassa OR74A]|uniref:Uncharacterized protein n=1 Tax=Neurospora crassa (strain ATCC 24698 / 74-OR23-1A / CBS 708.71 / DSM 1257 / FGSC 987) TaxID=367110 RepID=V5IKV4_NEUCR|nr:hypothetical protein NCU17185 [Neurospora crassa OR74A]ESA41870.1 hypothetical protein NCU17185 [Neurospora crassa OR74A]|eukprot:XP_011395356.1 hypothetical protein NCU17185 [Neurospora crassa OR74A]